jgi:predicted dehydrogenase
MTLNVAFYGAGQRAQPYLQALARRSDITLTGVCDPDRRAAEQTAAGWGAKVFPNWEALLQGADPQALWVGVKPDLQGDILAQAAERRIPFLVEPPGAVNYQKAQSCSHSIARSNLVTTVGFSSRFADVVREAREYLGAKPIPLAQAWCLCRPDETTSTVEQLLWTDACRIVDTLRLFCGEVTRVRSVPAGKGEMAESLVVQLEFAGGSVGSLTCTSFNQPEPRQELEFLGDGWSLGFGEGLGTLRLAERDKTTMLRCLNDPAADHVEAFLAAIAAQEPGAVACPYADALATLAVCHAAALSAREDRPVSPAEFDAM